MKIITDFKNDLLKRREVKAIVESPSNLGFQNSLSAITQQFKSKEDQVIIKAVKSKFGRKTFLIEAYIYDSVKDKESVSVIQTRLLRSYPNHTVIEWYKAERKPMSAETKKKISDSKMGRPRDEATRLKISLANTRGKYQGTSLFGSGTIAYQDLMSQGTTEKKELEDQLLGGKQEDQEPPMFFMG